MFLDTHIVVWLASGELERLSPKAYRYVSDHQPVVGPCVRLELKYLAEIGRINKNPDYIISYLHEEIGLEVVDFSWRQIIEIAIEIRWTRDVFDRLIVAEAKHNKAALITADKHIIKHYKKAIW